MGTSATPFYKETEAQKSKVTGGWTTKQLGLNSASPSSRASVVKPGHTPQQRADPMYGPSRFPQEPLGPAGSVLRRERGGLWASSRESGQTRGWCVWWGAVPLAGSRSRKLASLLKAPLCCSPMLLGLCTHLSPPFLAGGPCLRTPGRKSSDRGLSEYKQQETALKLVCVRSFLESGRTAFIILGRWSVTLKT